ncbi:hypothetical protein ARMSODRAFT_800960 [Armillaria solidipes]|uniref:Uncharacterized protein n=1 Tax=Armillaria solidipes TaxID=1076256 RepID=A0A2H3B6E1_9AGAR|nr:hypothetical protein ARMSODRAFT_800960 [Armillaria solidipes]
MFARCPKCRFCYDCGSDLPARNSSPDNAERVPKHYCPMIHPSLNVDLLSLHKTRRPSS